MAWQQHALMHTRQSARDKRSGEISHDLDAGIGVSHNDSVNPGPRRTALSNRSFVALRNQRGSGTVLTAAAMIGVIVTTLVALVVIGWVGSSRKARSAADLASLAGANAVSVGKDACAAAQRSAQSNGGTLELCTVESNGVDYVVRVRVSVPVTPNLPGGPQQTRADATAGSLPHP
jgi:secretion/DNA translocation related TadE-like protein